MSEVLSEDLLFGKFAEPKLFAKTSIITSVTGWRCSKRARGGIIEEVNRESEALRWNNWKGHKDFKIANSIPGDKNKNGL